MDTIALQQNITPSVSVTSVTQHSAVSQNTTVDTETGVSQTLQQPKDGLSIKEQEENIQKSIEKFNEMDDTHNLDVKFAYNDKLNQVYLNVIDKNTGETIRKLPSEEAMKIAENMKDLVGALFDKKG